MKLSTVPAPAQFDAVGSSLTPSLAAARAVWAHRAAFVVPIVAATLLGTGLAAAATDGANSKLRLVLLVLLGLNLLYMALTGWPTLVGCVVHLVRRPLRPTAAPAGISRTALVMPVYNESAADTFAAMEAMGRAIAESGLTGVDLFVLSDTTDPAIASAEQAAFDRLRAVFGAWPLPSGPTLSYRRRSENTGRKVGNLLDFCERWGSDYDYMVILDADSLMGASTIANLIGLMDDNPRAGIIQSVPYAIGRETPFARSQQFSARLYTPPLVEGLTFWQQNDGNYWGHNAIVRIAPFVAHCELPILPGREPFGGEILCHDVVEAGLMRAAGWDVWVLPATQESYEAVPANLVDFTARERRWCQGNLQHARVIADARLRPIGRFHLGYGIFHYLAAPLAVLFLGLATADSLAGGDFARCLLLNGSAPGHALAGLGFFLLYACKLVTLAITLADPEQSRGFGGRARLLASAALEQLGALVVTAVLITSYTTFIAALLRGQSVRWDPQPRDDRGVSWAEAWTRFRPSMIIGLIWMALLGVADPALLLWAAPLLFGLLAAVPAAYVSSRRDVGLAMGRLGLFTVPEERAPAAILRSYQRLVQTPASPPAAQGQPVALRFADAS